MKYVFPAVLEPEGSQFNVTFPDIEGCFTCGDSLNDALVMAEDVLNGWLSRLEERGEAIPEASVDVRVPEGCIFTLVRADTQAYRRRINAPSVRKNVTLPAWLAELAEERGVNFSQTLQKALREELGLVSS